MYHSLFICALLVSASLVAADQKFQLVWADEFENPTIDSTKWTVADNYYHCCNDELQLYTQDEVFVKNGNLILRSSQKPSGKYNYTSGWIDTFGKFSTTYGKVEVRAKLPFGKGIWPAHWMLPATDFCWPVGGEIDIMEYLGVNPTDPPGPVYGTLHWSANKTCNRDVHSGSFYPPKDATWIDYTKSYHVFSMEWSPTNIKFFVDGHMYHTVPNWLFTPSTPFYLILNTAVGGNWGGNPNAMTKFPQYHFIDYVRVYKLAS